MYIPPLFRDDDTENSLSFMRRYPFAALIAVTANGLEAQHLPMFASREPATNAPIRIHGHMARNNPAAEILGSEQELLVIFSGPHAYISPTLYLSPGVPTWNYAAVHAYCRSTAIEERSALEALLQRQTSAYEETNGTNWTLNAVLPEQREPLLKSIIGFELRVDRLEAKYKLSQNRPMADRAAVRSYLSGHEDSAARQIAHLMADFRN